MDDEGWMSRSIADRCGSIPTYTWSYYALLLPGYWFPTWTIAIRRELWPFDLLQDGSRHIDDYVILFSRRV